MTVYIVILPSTDDGGEDVQGRKCICVEDLASAQALVSEFPGADYYSFEVTGPL